ncbi:tRNA(His) guanylyltransferase Thg1 family protein [Moraxella equi]|uniref:tRNA(His) guanylyltransferase n=1 Tax=Moraxella equi TaxID=60442 RepID=A0A378QP41_9GAMM|nr:tRNA(His) guanylyltransferase Thg1 family protein [Moraxella equi]OPH35516.1 guanylyltransferase [Moraxella equi]STZ02637.1 Uncharacterized conserved protein [Moraxella equi]
MRFDELDTRLRQYETLHDSFVLPDVHMVVRLDGRGFTKKADDVWQLNRPFDDTFHHAMTKTTEHLMNTGFRVVYGYTQSDEISLLLHINDDSFNRKTRKIISLLAGEASGVFSLIMNAPASFDARICELPTQKLVQDYFSWRQEDAHRNDLNTHCYWLLRKQGQSPKASADFLLYKSVGEKHELLFQNGINFNDVPNWQKRGVGIYWQDIQKDGFNPKTGEQTTTLRRTLAIDDNLPIYDEYREMIGGMLG